MYTVKTTSEVAQGLGLWVLVAFAIFLLWYGVGYLFGDTDRRRTPLQNLTRRALMWFRWAGAVLTGVSYAIDAGLYGYYLAMRKPLRQPRSERIRKPTELVGPKPLSLGVPAMRLLRRSPGKVA